MFEVSGRPFIWSGEGDNEVNLLWIIFARLVGNFDEAFSVEEIVRVSRAFWDGEAFSDVSDVAFDGGGCVIADGFGELEFCGSVGRPLDLEFEY